MHSICQVYMCLAITVVVNDATVREFIVKLIGTQEMFLKQPSLGSGLMAGLMLFNQVQLMVRLMLFNQVKI